MQDALALPIGSVSSDSLVSVSADLPMTEAVEKLKACRAVAVDASGERPLAFCPSVWLMCSAMIDSTTTTVVHMIAAHCLYSRRTCGLPVHLGLPLSAPGGLEHPRLFHDGARLPHSRLLRQVLLQHNSPLPQRE
jgi:hypothetical protein